MIRLATRTISAVYSFLKPHWIRYRIRDLLVTLRTIGLVIVAAIAAVIILRHVGVLPTFTAGRSAALIGYVCFAFGFVVLVVPRRWFPE